MSKTISITVRQYLESDRYYSDLQNSVHLSVAEPEQAGELG